MFKYIAFYMNFEVNKCQGNSGTQNCTECIWKVRGLHQRASIHSC